MLFVTQKGLFIAWCILWSIKTIIAANTVQTLACRIVCVDDDDDVDANNAVGIENEVADNAGDAIHRNYGVVDNGAHHGNGGDDLDDDVAENADHGLHGNDGVADEDDDDADGGGDISNDSRGDARGNLDDVNYHRGGKIYTNDLGKLVRSNKFSVCHLYLLHILALNNFWLQTCKITVP